MKSALFRRNIWLQIMDLQGFKSNKIKIGKQTTKKLTNIQIIKDMK